MAQPAGPAQHQKVCSVDIDPLDDTSDNKTESAGLKAIERSVERTRHSVTQKRVDRVVEQLNRGGDVAFRLKQGLFDQFVQDYLESHGWSKQEIIYIEVGLDVETEYLPKDYLCHRIVNEAIQKGKLEVFKVVPKDLKDIPDILDQINQKIEQDPDNQVYRAMREAASEKPKISHLERLLGNRE